MAKTTLSSYLQSEKPFVRCNMSRDKLVHTQTVAVYWSKQRSTVTSTAYPQVPSGHRNYHNILQQQEHPPKVSPNWTNSIPLFAICIPLFITVYSCLQCSDRWCFSFGTNVDISEESLSNIIVSHFYSQWFIQGVLQEMKLLTIRLIWDVSCVIYVLPSGIYSSAL